MGLVSMVEEGGSIDYYHILFFSWIQTYFEIQFNWIDNKWIEKKIKCIDWRVYIRTVSMEFPAQIESSVVHAYL